MKNSKLLITVQNLHIETIVKLGEVVFIPCYNLQDDNDIFDSNISDKERRKIDIFINKNMKFIEQCAHNSIVLAYLDISRINNEHIDEKSILEQGCEKVNRALDFIRINYCRFNLKETLPGIPGVLDGSKIGFLVDDDTTSLKVIEGDTYNFYLQPGIGLDADLYCPESDELYDVIFSGRNDEVYLEHRAILARACDAMYITDLNRCFSYLFSSVERMGSIEYKKFEIRKKRIMAWIARDEEEYRRQNLEFLFFSKEVRTEIVHKGKDILEIVSKAKANQIINSLFLVILRYCKKTIMSQITDYNQLEIEIEKRVEYFEEIIKVEGDSEDSEQKEDICTVKDNDILGQVLVIIPIMNLEVNNVIRLGNAIIVPKDTKESINNNWEENSTINNNILNDILENSQIRKLNKEAVLCIFPQEYSLEEEWYPDKEMDFLEVICKKSDKLLNYIVLKYCKISNQNCMPSNSGIYDGYRTGLMYNLENKECRMLLGKVYHMYVETKERLVVDTFDIKEIDKELYNCLYSTRTDEIFINCRNALARICEAFYLSNHTISITYMFDTLDMLDPLHVDLDKLRTTILPFISDNRSEYFSIGEEMKQLNEKFRTPMLHHGKSIYEIVESSQEIYEVFERIMKWIVKYCERVVATNIDNFDDLQNERKNRMKGLGIN